MRQMKQAGVQELVLDLRLCNDGTLDMACRLASYVVSPDVAGSTFAKTFWNAAYAANNQVLPYDATVDNLGLSRIYILTSSYTQGASEWLIHGLQHSMGEENVILIGQSTKGQNVMTEEVGSQYYVHLFPAVAYVADGDGDYSYGSIEPTVTLDEQAYLNLGDYGSPAEILFNSALQHILHGGQNGSGEGEDSDNSAEDAQLE